MPNRIVQPVHFEDFDGHQFERLVFAYLLRTDKWLSLDWYGQAGGDSGRDMWGIRERDQYPKGQQVCVQCTNQKSLPYKKVQEDLKKILGGPNGKPDVFIVVTGGTVSATLRDKTKNLCVKEKIYTHEIWSGKEFEERLRAKVESLLKRFIDGVEFPDTPRDIYDFVASSEPQSDDEIIGLMTGLFDRPAFYTPFNQESSIPAFKKAITDTIEALNTGIHRLRDGTEIRRIPSRHAIQSPATKKILSQVEQILVELRGIYDEGIKNGEIRLCGCNDPDCPVFFVSPGIANEMDRLRREILDTLRRLYPPFDVRLAWRHWDC